MTQMKDITPLGVFRHYKTAPPTQYFVLTDDMQKFGVNEGVQYATSHMDMQTFMRDKLAKYKAIYNQLPRGYFK